MKSESPTGQSLVPELGSESGMTPLHLASYSGNENVVRLLLNSAGVQVDAATSENVSAIETLKWIEIGQNNSILGIQSVTFGMFWWSYVGSWFAIE